ncbi:MAG: ATP-binding protein [Verrucomicrobiota bacterium]
MNRVKDHARLKAVRATRLLDTPSSEGFDRLTSLAANLLASPVAMVSLVEEEHQFFKSAVGLPMPWAARRQMPLTHSFCQHVVQTGGPLVVNDARQDPHLSESHAVRELNAVSYLGVPLCSKDGHTLGVFGVMDNRPRQWQPGEVGLVSELARSVISEIDFHVRETELREQLARHQFCFDQMPVACLMADAAGRITRWNQAATRLFGFSTSQVIGAAFHKLLFAPDRQAGVLAELRALAAAGRLEKIRMPVRAAGSRELQCEWSLVAMRSAAGQVEGFVATAEDLNQSSQTRQELAHATEQLRQVQKVAALGQLTAGVIHDFNNIIAIILAQAGFLKLAPASPAKAEESLSKIFEAAGHGAQLTRRLLMFGKPQPAPMINVDLNQLVGGLLQMLQRLLPKQIEINQNLTRWPLVVRADPGLIEQVVLNLILNARDAMPDGGRLTIETSLERVGETAPAPARPGNFARVTIRDTGCGIPSEVRPHIFEPFFTTKPAESGTGLGLSIVNGIVKDSQGWLSVDSQVGAGTAFHVYLPLLEMF